MSSRVQGCQPDDSLVALIIFLGSRIWGMRPMSPGWGLPAIHQTLYFLKYLLDCNILTFLYIYISVTRTCWETNSGGCSEFITWLELWSQPHQAFKSRILDTFWYVLKSSFKLKNDRISICRNKLVLKYGCDYFLKYFLFENILK